MKTISLNVTLEFADDMPTKFVPELVSNIASNLRADAQTAGLVPDDCQTYTTRISVQHGKDKAVERVSFIRVNLSNP
jgi:hypothetical protein